MRKIISEPKERVYTFYERIGGQSSESIRLSAGDEVSEEMLNRYSIPDAVLEEVDDKKE